jgi:hypothetical protein
MNMVGRSRNRFRLVTLVTMVATLLAAWLPTGRACACAPATGKVIPNVEAAAVCPCCGTRPAADEAPRACCQAHPAPASQGQDGACGCGSPARPGSPEPTAPPRTGDADESHVLTAALVAPVAGAVLMVAGPTAAETVVRRTDPPPTDLVISLSRITC